MPLSPAHKKNMMQSDGAVCLTGDMEGVTKARLDEIIHVP